MNPNKLFEKHKGKKVIYYNYMNEGVVEGIVCGYARTYAGSNVLIMALSKPCKCSWNYKSVIGWADIITFKNHSNGYLHCSVNDVIE